MTLAAPLGQNNDVFVLLARIEGKVDGIVYQIGDIVKRVDSHDASILTLTLATQRLGDEATSRDATVASTAKALREAKEAQDAATRAEVAKSDQTWTPMTRLFASTTAIATIASTLYFVLHG